MPARTATRKPSGTAARVPSYRKNATLLERLQKGQRWTIKRNAVTNVPERLLRWDGKRSVHSCSVSLRVSGQASAAQKALVEAAETLEALTAERERIVSLLGAGAGADGKSVAEWLKAIETAGHTAETHKARAAFWETQAQQAKERVENANRLLSEAREDRDAAIARQNGLYTAIVERLDSYYPADSRDLEWDVLPGTLAALAQRCKENTEEVEQLASQNARLITERTELEDAAFKLRTIIMDALGIEEGNRTIYPLLESAENLVAILAEKTHAVGELRGSLTNRNEQISRLVQERDQALVENKDLAGKLTAERGANVAHQHARRMGWLMSIGALLLSIPLTLWISGFWSWRAGR